MRAPMAELVDASDSKSDSARSAGSIPARGTIPERNRERSPGRGASGRVQIGGNHDAPSSGRKSRAPKPPALTGCRAQACHFRVRFLRFQGVAAPFSIRPRAAGLAAPASAPRRCARRDAASLPARRRTPSAKIPRIAWMTTVHNLLIRHSHRDYVLRMFLSRFCTRRYLAPPPSAPVSW